MKDPKEKKTRMVPTRMTQAQYEEVRNKAKERNMSVSSFVVDAATHNDQKINPHQLLQIQNLINLAADACEQTNPILARELREGGDDLWQSL